MATRTLITMPATARRGEVIEIRTLIGHPMEPGFRVDAQGRQLPRNIIRRFVCIYDSETVFRAELSPAIAANPYIAFHTVAMDTGTLHFLWEGDEGFSHSERVTLTVT
jgi:sulfur-oxidizing protein SoxZ